MKHLPFVLLVQALLRCTGARAFSAIRTTSSLASHKHQRRSQHTTTSLASAIGEFTEELRKPLGIVLEERDGGGVKVKDLVEGGAAATRTDIASGDVLLRVDDRDVSALEFDAVMDLLASLDDASPVRLALSDGLGRMDMPKNVARPLRTTEDAFLVDAVVRRAVRELRRRKGRLGDLLRVEVIVGAGVRDDEGGRRRGQARFFAIFSTDGGATSYSCNVSATGVRGEDGSVEIVSLSAAKDEGLGQTFEFI